MRHPIPRTVVAALFVVLRPLCGHAAPDDKVDVGKVVEQAIRPILERYAIPGMAVGVVFNGRGTVYDFGVMSKQTGSPVEDDTLFEVGSVSKTVTATLASYAEVKGRLALSDRASQALPALGGSHFDEVSLLDLATHTSGGLPLQVPDNVTNDAELMRYFRSWKPAYAPGTYRTYANPSIGLLGLIAAKSLNEDFDEVEKRELFQPLGMTRAYLHVPDGEAAHYAQGYTKADAPTRMAPGELASEAYGIRTTAGDMLRFVEANLGMIALDKDLQRAIINTHTGYDQIGPMTQDLIWEQYPYPVALEDLLEGNSAKVSYEANPVVKLDPPLPPQENVLINKTGSTNGFASYVAFVPGLRIGIVLLANKNYPIDARVTAGYEILTRLSDGSPRH